MKPLISIIIPAYNVEKSIKKCLDSLLSQTFSKFKIYIVNDGSTDNTLKILRSYKNNSKIEVINQKNQGVSVARNNALIRVKTPYIAFVDADDYVKKDYLTHLIQGFSDRSIDLVIDQIKCDVSTIKVVKADQIMSQLFKKDGLGGFLWNKLFRTNIIKNNGIFFDQTLKIAEDLVFCETYLTYCNFVTILPYNDYFYVRSFGSISNKEKLTNYTITFYDNYIQALELLLRIMKTQYGKLSNDIRAEICNVNFDYFRMLKLQDRYSSTNVNIILDKILHNRTPFFKSYNIGFKRKIMLILFILNPKIITFIDRLNN
ncbi:glycosyltransferase family 2 protein [Limosilactobacillus reuteri]|uniref:glycosyltransferase family 2 protein n=1 Tax=Limosilactobacillus reuteri TaxID=1598 RepID=UPI00117EB03A|nr:glycosyltransferase family A protein [Limosilactobacillus reuteri]MCC4346848.1 glycosyltransferase family 2 protein [Limosilactobacillus reuteri]MCT3203227.1 glycosyltransferase family 2 protein [Limosilactobacillus reuteri]MCT3211836.1 glycosyltransferase family 2 protein [Limosilactobacillus reuteri]TSB18836.1 glycosyltransferase family 2 protein [Limosilactobacillus reuteri]